MTEKAIEAAAKAIHAADADKEGPLSEDEREGYRMMARAAIAAYEKAMWRPIEEAPKDETVLVFLPGASQGMDIELANCSADDPDADWYPATRDASPLDIQPTHFRPLPPVPEGE